MLRLRLHVRVSHAGCFSVDASLWSQIFLGLSHILPASAFTPAEWQALMVAASSGAAKGKKKLSPLQKLHADIRQLQETIQAMLTPRRLLATVAMTRTAYHQVEARLTTVFQADN